jgi:hypothetical protein
MNANMCVQHCSYDLYLTMLQEFMLVRLWKSSTNDARLTILYKICLHNHSN